jgi:hypothetical protein
MKEGHDYKHPDIYEELLALMTREYFVSGFSVSLVKSDYDAIAGEIVCDKPIRYWCGGAYSFCVGAIVHLANR